MKRLLCLIGNMNTGGAETFLMKLYRNIDRTKYQMDFCINTEKECFYNSEIRNMGGKIYYIPPKSCDIKGFKRQLADLIKKEKYEYVIKITSNAVGFMDLKIAKKAGARVCAARSSNSSDGDNFKVKALHYLSRFLYEHYVDVKFAPSDLAAEYTFGKGTVRKGQVSILHNAVDLNIYRFYNKERQEIRKELGLENKKVIGHIGRFMQQKNHSFLLDIFYEIKKKEPNSVLLLVGGNGDLEPIVRQKISDLGLEDSVVFSGVRADIPQILSAMDVFVMPSFFEGMPNTVIEAQATGLPCVISDTITKQANITGLVEYLPLSQPASFWADNALAVISNSRIDTKQHFVDNGYDIERAAKKFVKLIFGDEQ